jgi:hypothetical protein
MKQQYQRCGKAGRTVVTVGPFAYLQLKTAGYSDGNRGLPNGTSGRFSSAFIARELEGLRQFCTKQWLLCESLSADLHIETSELQNNIGHLQKIVATHEAIKLKSNAATPLESNKRRLGEDALDSQIIAERRIKEAQKAAVSSLWQPMLSYHDAQEQIAKLERRLSIVQESILELERQTRLKCLCRENRTNRRIAIYWNSAWRAANKNPTDTMRLPAEPPLLVRNSEQVYLLQHQRELEVG